MKVSLWVNGHIYSGWTSIRISAGLDRLARDFELGVTFRFPGSSDVWKAIHPFDSCQVRIGDTAVVTGYVDAVPVEYDAASCRITVRGRSKTALLVDCCSRSRRQFSAQSAVSILRTLCQEYGIEVVDSSGEAGVLMSFSHRVEDKVEAAIRQIVSRHRLVLTDDGEGRLHVVKTGMLTATDDLALGRNIVSVSAPNDWADVYSEYRVSGQTASGAPVEADDGDGTELEGGFTFERVLTEPRYAMPYRLLSVTATGAMSSEQTAQRLEYERLNRIAKARARTVTVRGWTQESGELWLPNQRVRLSDPVSGVEGEMLITGCVWSASPALTTELSLTDREGFGVPPPEGAGQTGGGGASGQNTWAFVPKVIKAIGEKI